MNLRKYIQLAIFFLITTPVLGQNYSGNQEDIDQILENISSFSECYMNEDFECIAQAYTSDGKILPPSTDIIEGHEAIKRRWTMPDGFDVLHHKIMPTEIEVIGGRAYDVGYYEGKTRRPDGSEISFTGKYVIVWEKINDEWKIHLDIWNSRNGE